MTYTTQGLMTAADQADLYDLYDLGAGLDEARAEEEAMEDAHAEHADQCRACQEEAQQRETGARVALAMDEARRELEKAVQEALRIMPLAYSGPTRKVLEEGLEKARTALSRI